MTPNLDMAVLDLVKAGDGAWEIARKLGVSREAVEEVLTRYIEAGKEETDGRE